MLNITFTGNVGADPVLRQVKVGEELVYVATFSVAITNPNSDLPPTWIKVSTWREYAKVVAQYIRKGHRVSVSAENVKATAWTDSEGELRAGIEVSARRVDFGGNRRRDEDDDDAPQAQAQAGKSRQQQPARQTAKRRFRLPSRRLRPSPSSAKPVAAPPPNTTTCRSSHTSPQPPFGVAFIFWLDKTLQSGDKT